MQRRYVVPRDPDRSERQRRPGAAVEVADAAQRPTGRVHSVSVSAARVPGIRPSPQALSTTPGSWLEHLHREASRAA